MVQESRQRPFRQPALLDGSYHGTLPAASEDARDRHIRVLNEYYLHSLALVERQGWKNPLDRESPRVLLCGTGSALTTVTFINFVHQRNPNAKIFVLDLSSHPLMSSKKKLSERKEEFPYKKNVSFIQADAVEMPFFNDSFDWIETDSFLQFFPSSEKPMVFAEWRRTLKKGGVVTTREPVTKHDTEEIRREHEALNKSYGVQMYRTTIDEVHSLMTAASFDTVLQPVDLSHLDIPNLPSINSNYIVARKK